MFSAKNDDIWVDSVKILNCNSWNNVYNNGNYKELVM